MLLNDRVEVCIGAHCFYDWFIDTKYQVKTGAIYILRVLQGALQPVLTIWRFDHMAVGGGVTTLWIHFR